MDADKVDTATNISGASDLVTLIGQAEDSIAANDIAFASGSWNATTKVFTILADGVGSDALILDSGIDTDIMSSDDMFILRNVDTDDLVHQNFI